MNPSTDDDAWLFADAEAWREFGEAYAAEFDDLVVVPESVRVSRSGRPIPKSRGRQAQRPRTPRLVLVGGG